MAGMDKQLLHYSNYLGERNEEGRQTVESDAPTASSAETAETRGVRIGQEKCAPEKSCAPGIEKELAQSPANDLELIYYGFDIDDEDKDYERSMRSKSAPIWPQNVPLVDGAKLPVSAFGTFSISASSIYLPMPHQA